MRSAAQGSQDGCVGPLVHRLERKGSARITLGPVLAIEPKANTEQRSVPNGPKADARRAQVLQAAARAIGEKGVDRVRLRDVARTARVSIGLIQHYFETREALLHATFEAFNNEFVEEWERIATTVEDPVERVDALLRLSCFEPDGWEGVAWGVWFEFWSICRRDPEFRRQYGAIYDEWRRPFREAIEHGVKAGTFKPELPVRDLADTLIAQIEGLRVAVTLEPGRISRERMLALVRAFAETQLGASFGGTRDPRSSEVA